MKFLLTGAMGQVGEEVLRQGELWGAVIQPLSRDQLDITDADGTASAVLRTDGLTAVLNAAAFTDVDGAEANPNAAFRVNRDGVANLARACRRKGVPLVHVSTDHVFGGGRSGTFTPQDRADPVNTYGRSKLAGEDALREILDRHVILRTSWVFGARGRNFVTRVLERARNLEELSVVSDEVGCPTGAGHVAHAMLSVGRLIGRGGFDRWGTYHYSGRPCLSRADFARHVFAQAASHRGLPSARVRPESAKALALPARRPSSAVLDGNATQEDLGLHMPEWKPYLATVLRALSGDETA